KHGAGRPCADHRVCQCRMERMPQPDAVEPVLDAPCRWPTLRYGGIEQPLQLVGPVFEHLVLLRAQRIYDAREITHNVDTHYPREVSRGCARIRGLLRAPLWLIGLLL